MKRTVLIAFSVIVSIGLTSLDRVAMATVPGVNQRISVTPSGGQSNNDSSGAFISGDGKMVAFSSHATTLLFPYTSGYGQFIRNLSTGVTARFDVSSSGVVADDTSYNTIREISYTGRYILFTSRASNLIDGVSTPTDSPQLYLRDTVNSTTTQLSRNANNGYSLRTLGVSSDGRFVSFSSYATNLHPDAIDGKAHLYMLDRSTDTIEVLDRLPDGSFITNNFPPIGDMSCDGSLIVFQYGNNLIPSQPNSNHVDTYLLDRRGGSDKLTNLTRQFNGAGLMPSISCNGDYVGFESQGTNIDQTYPPNYLFGNRPYVYDRINDKYHLVALSSSNAQTNVPTCGTSASAHCVKISDDGLASFRANDVDLAGVSGNQIYIRDIKGQTTELLTIGVGGAPGNGGNMSGPSISADGSIIAYSSDSSNLVPNDTNARSDVFTSLTGH